MNYLLFSSVLGTGQKIVDIHQTIGLDLIAPLALRTILEKELQNFEQSAILKRIFAGSADRGALPAVFGCCDNGWRNGLSVLRVSWLIYCLIVPKRGSIVERVICKKN